MLAFHRTLVGILLCLLIGSSFSGGAAAEEAAAVRHRLTRGVQFLSSDELGGRGLGTPGIDRAAEFIRFELEQAGLVMTAIDGGPFQPFVYTASASLGEGNWAKLIGPEGAQALALDEAYSPLAIGGTGKFDLPLVFAGYGITAPELDYDDYQGLDVAGKCVIIVRHEPQQGDPQSRFNGTDDTSHASFRSKIRNAIDHGAAAIIFCTSGYEIERQLTGIDRRIASTQRQLDRIDGQQPSEQEEVGTLEESAEDEQPSQPDRRERLATRLAQLHRQRLEVERGLLRFSEGGISNDGARIPVLICSREVVETIFAQSGRASLAEWETKVDQTGGPESFACHESRFEAEVLMDREDIPVKNVLGVIPGSGPQAEETVVIGAHYDHLGLGNPGRGEGEIHNGADDNASGTMVLLELARRFAQRENAPARRLVFIAFTAEEKGLLGSAHYVNNPPFPLSSTVGMVNFDMVGRMKNNELYVNGVGTAAPFSSWLAEDNSRSGFSLQEVPGGKGPSDHASFCHQGIPVIHFFTGLHAEYHRPSDDFELLDYDGMGRLCDLAEAFIDRLANHPTRLEFIDAEGPSMPKRRESPSGPRVWFGVRVDTNRASEGLFVLEVLKQSPAEKAGLHAEDLVMKLGESPIKNLGEFQRLLGQHQPGDRISLTIVREGAERVVEAELAAPPKVAGD